MTGSIVERYDSAAGFLAGAGSFLEKRETENNLVLGILSDLEIGPSFGDEAPYLACVRSGADVVGVAIRTPPFGVVLSVMEEPGAAADLAADVFLQYSEIPGVLGPLEPSAAFVKAWGRLTQTTARLSRHERIHRCGRVKQIESSPGRMRALEETDLPLVVRWMQSFMSEVLPEQHREDAQVLAAIERRRSSRDGGVFLWEVDGDVVTMAGCGGRTPNSIRVGPVYTPPERRGRGFATSLVAALTSLLLARGIKFCCLFTDLANPTSNSIYRKVGYGTVIDVDEYRFERV